MTSAIESLRLAFRVSDKQFVVRDSRDNDVFAGTYREVESWLDQQENAAALFTAKERLDESEDDSADAILKATILTQEMVDKALAADAQPAPKPVDEAKSKENNFRSRLFGRKQKFK